MRDEVQNNVDSSLRSPHLTTLKYIKQDTNRWRSNIIAFITSFFKQTSLRHTLSHQDTKNAWTLIYELSRVHSSMLMFRWLFLSNYHCPSSLPKYFYLEIAHCYNYLIARFPIFSPLQFSRLASFTVYAPSTSFTTLRLHWQMRSWTTSALSPSDIGGRTWGLLRMCRGRSASPESWHDSLSRGQMGVAFRANTAFCGNVGQRDRGTWPDGRKIKSQKGKRSGFFYKKLC